MRTVADVVVLVGFVAFVLGLLNAYLLIRVGHLRRQLQALEARLKHLEAESHGPAGGEPSTAFREGES